MEEVPIIETEWGGELHRELIAEKAQLRLEWRGSPGAIEDLRRMSVARPSRWEGIVIPAVKRKKTPIHRWTS